MQGRESLGHMEDFRPKISFSAMGVPMCAYVCLCAYLCVSMCVRSVFVYVCVSIW